MFFESRWVYDNKIAALCEAYSRGKGRVRQMFFGWRAYSRHADGSPSWRYVLPKRAWSQTHEVYDIFKEYEGR